MAEKMRLRFKHISWLLLISILVSIVPISTQRAFAAAFPGFANPIESTLTASPVSVIANGASSTTLTVTIKDASNVPVLGHAISLSQGSGSSTITPVSGTTDASGQAVFTVTNTRAEAVTYTATDTTASPNVTVTQTVQVTFIPG